MLRYEKWIAPHKCRDIAPLGPTIAIVNKQVLMNVNPNHRNRARLLVFTKQDRIVARSRPKL